MCVNRPNVQSTNFSGACAYFGLRPFNNLLRQSVGWLFCKTVASNHIGDCHTVLISEKMDHTMRIQGSLQLDVLSDRSIFAILLPNPMFPSYLLIGGRVSSVLSVEVGGLFIAKPDNFLVCCCMHICHSIPIQNPASYPLCRKHTHATWPLLHTTSTCLALVQFYLGVNHTSCCFHEYSY